MVLGCMMGVIILMTVIGTAKIVSIITTVGMMHS